MPTCRQIIITQNQTCLRLCCFIQQKNKINAQVGWATYTLTLTLTYMSEVWSFPRGLHIRIWFSRSSSFIGKQKQNTLPLSWMGEGLSQRREKLGRQCLLKTWAYFGLFCLLSLWYGILVMAKLLLHNFKMPAWPLSVCRSLTNAIHSVRLVADTHSHTITRLL